MKILFYFDEKGIHHKAEKTHDKKDGSISLKYTYKDLEFYKKSVFPKSHYEFEASAHDCFKEVDR